MSRSTQGSPSAAMTGCPTRVRVRTSPSTMKRTSAPGGSSPSSMAVISFAKRGTSSGSTASHNSVRDSGRAGSVRKIEARPSDQTTAPDSRSQVPHPMEAMYWASSDIISVRFRAGRQVVSTLSPQEAASYSSFVRCSPSRCCSV